MFPTSKVDTLVIDSGPIIKAGVKVKDFATNFVTIPEVLKEIKDRQSRQQLALFPFEIKVRTPTDEAYKAVMAFAKKTGDFQSLSLVDLKVLALTYMLEKEMCGAEHIRTEPVKITQQTPVSKVTELSASSPLPTNTENNEKTEPLTECSQASADLKTSEEEAQADSLAQKFEELKVDNSKSHSDLEADEIGSSNEDSDDDSDGDWITPANLKQKQLVSLGHSKEESKVQEERKVACITTDYAMQSVILQMNLGLVSIEGLIIKNLRSWILRCHACFKLTTNLAKQFCPSCGGPTLTRVACSVKADGEFQLYLKKDYVINNRGTKYRMTGFKGGQHNTDIIIAEDQKEYRRALRKYNRRKEANLFDPDFIPGIISGKQNPGNRPPVIGYGRRNPNQVRNHKKK